jgi:hypothetical protein
MNETEWAYLAGLIDGEGYLNILLHTSPSGRKHGKGYARDFILTICNTQKELLVTVKEKLGFGYIYEHKRKEGTIGANTFTLRFSHNELRGVLPKILPYLLLKKDAAQIMLDSLNIIKEISLSEERENMLLQKGLDFKNSYSKHQTPFMSRGTKRKEENRLHLQKVIV